MFVDTMSPRHQSGRLISSFTNERSLVDVMKEELRSSMVREEDYKYQILMYDQQNQDLLRQHEVLYVRLAQLQEESQLYEEQAQIHKEKCDMMNQYISNKNQLKSSEETKQEINKLKQHIQQLQAQLQKNEAVQYEEILMKIQMCQAQCQELRNQNNDLRSQNNELQNSNDTIRKLSSKQTESKEQELNLIKHKLFKLEQLYSQKAESVDEFFNDAEAKIIQEKKLNQGMQEELQIIHHDKQKLLVLVTKLKEEIECRHIEYCDLQDQYQQSCDQLKLNNQRFQSDLKFMEKEQESKYGEFDNNNSILRDKLSQQQEMALQLQNQMNYLEEICFTYKKSCDQSKIAISQSQSQITVMQEENEMMKQNYLESQQENLYISQQLLAADNKIEDLEIKLKNTKTIESDSSNYYMGKNSQIKQIMTDQSDSRKNDSQMNGLQCRIIPRSSVSTTPQSNMMNMHRSQISMGGVTLKTEENKNENNWDHSLPQKESERSNKFHNISGTIKRNDTTTKHSNKSQTVNTKLNNSERNFNSLVQSCQTSEYSSNIKKDKENSQPPQSKTLDQLQAKYLNLRNRIHLKQI